MFDCFGLVRAARAAGMKVGYLPCGLYSLGDATLVPSAKGLILTEKLKRERMVHTVEELQQYVASPEQFWA